MADPRYSLFAARAVFDPRLTATDVRVLAALGTYSNKQGWCNPKQATVAIRVGVSRTTVTASLKRLMETGYVETTHQVVAGRGQTASKYRVILDLEPLSATTTPGADVELDDSPVSVEPTPRCQPGRQPGVVPVGHPLSSQLDTQKEHSQLNIPKELVVAVARPAAVISKAMIEEAQTRAGKAANLTSGHLHHGAVLRQLLDGGCEWQDVLDAIDALAASMNARGKQFHSWAIISEPAQANRDRRLAGLPAPSKPSEQTNGRPQRNAAERDAWDRVLADVERDSAGGSRPGLALGKS